MCQGQRCWCVCFEACPFSRNLSIQDIRDIVVVFTTHVVWSWPYELKSWRKCIGVELLMLWVRHAYHSQRNICGFCLFYKKRYVYTIYMIEFRECHPKSTMNGHITRGSMKKKLTGLDYLRSDTYGNAYSHVFVDCNRYLCTKFLSQP